MTSIEIIENLRSKLSTPVGRHLYGILGNYKSLDMFSKKLSQAKTAEGTYFPLPLNVNRGILESIPDDEFRELIENEAKRPEPTAAHVAKAFEVFLRAQLKGHKILILSNLELLFAYNLELNLLRSMATDEHAAILLLPGKRQGGRVPMFPNVEGGNYQLPTNLIADNNMWEISL
jgi:hypothetical protein